MSDAVVWVIPKWTFPCNDGARVATDALVRATVAAGARLHVLCLALPDEVVDEAMMRAAWGVESVTVLRRRLPAGRVKRAAHYAWQFLRRPALPITMSSFAEPRFARALEALRARTGARTVVLDGLHLGAFGLQGGRWRRPADVVVLRAHNVEAELWRRARTTTRSPLTRLLLAHQHHVMARAEARIARGVDGIAAIAPEDADLLRDVAPGTPIRVVPLGMDFSRPLPLPAEAAPLRLLFLGRLDWAANRDSLTWLLRDIWPSVHRHRPDLQLSIAGSGDGAWLSAYAGLGGVELLGRVEDVRTVYERAHFAVVPMRYGSGTRIKVVEAFAMNRPLISTAMGVQGAFLGDGDYVRADTSEEWIARLRTLTWDPAIVAGMAAARERLSASLDQRAVGTEFARWLGDLRTEAPRRVAA